MTRNRTFGLAASAFALLLIFMAAACGPGSTGSDNKATPMITLQESFDSPADVAARKGTLVGETDTAFVEGFEGNGYWLGEGNQLIYPGTKIIHPEQGTIEFWICLKNRWNDGKLHHILALGSTNAFSIVKAPETDTLRFTLHGKSIDFKSINPFLGEVYQHQWRAGWHHVAVTWRNLGQGPEGEMVLYLDGEVKNYFVQKLPRVDNQDPLVIGELEPGHSADAVIDELKIYNYFRPNWDFAGVEAPFEVEPSYELTIYPTPHPVGLLPGEGFTLGPDTLLVVGEERLAEMSVVIDVFNDAVESTYGYRLKTATTAEVSSFDNAIVIGASEDNALVAELAQTYKLPAGQDNPGPDAAIIEVMKQGIVVAGVDYSGSVKALLLLTQLVRLHPDEYFPRYLIVDYPDMGFRATEIREGEFLTTELKERLLYFKAIGLSHVIFNIDAYFALDDPLVAERVKGTFDYARALGLEPIPLINGYSYSEKLIERCAEDGVDCSEDGRPATYSPGEPYVYVIMGEAMERTVELLSPKYIHLGHDNIKTFNKDPRTIALGMSPAELYVYDLERVSTLAHAADPSVKLMAWYDMVNPMHHAGFLSGSAPGDNPPDPPAIADIAPRNLIWCPYINMTWDDTMAFIFPMFTLNGLKDGFFGTYVVGPTENDMVGAASWIRLGREKGAIGFVNRPMQTETLEHNSWLSLPVAAELAWSYFVPVEHDDVWYDYADNNANYGGF